MNNVKYLLFLFLPLVVFAQHSERELNSNWLFKQIGKGMWMPAKVPGSVHSDLFENKIIADPFFADNEKLIQWVENEDWEYNTEFMCSPKELNSKNIEIKFDGLDTYAKVLLNGNLILQADNMFRSWSVDVKKYLKPGKNVLTIQFLSAVKREKIEAKKLPYTLPDNERVFTRKAAFQYGWDFAPRLVSCGIWKAVHLCFFDEWRFVNQYVQQNILNDSLAELTFQFQIHSDAKHEFVIKISDAGNSKINYASKNFLPEKGDSIYKISFQINHPKLWWCKGYGEQNLYHFSTTLLENNLILDQKILDIGIRKIELIREKDKTGESFYFKLNGFPVFMKGSNYVPQDILPSRVTKSDYLNIVKSAADANMNMLRVWGGGVYPDDEFYKQCDENGILVWQDFMFAGAMYPGDFLFLENVKEEIKQQVIRLRNHPSLALWCGNNEIDEAWKNWGWQKQYHISSLDSGLMRNDYVNLFENLIPEIISENDVNRTNLFWPSSPSIGWGHKESLFSGDSHYWGVWWGNEKFETYTKKIGRFMSEYGFQSMPSIHSIKKFVTTDDLNFGNEAFKNHQKNAHGFENIQSAIFDEYKPVNDFEKYIFLSQLVQANGMKTAIEAHRNAKPNCMGSLFWQLNDCWPSISWSAIDYYGNRKALYYQSKRSFNNLLITYKEVNNGIEVHLVSDNLNAISGKFEIRLLDLNGKILWNESSSSLIHFASYSSEMIYLLEKQVFEKYNRNEIMLSCNIVSDEKLEMANSQFYFTRDGDLKLTKPSFKLTKIDGHTFTLSSDVVAKDVYIQLDDDEIKLSDNFFDIIPGKGKILKIEETKSFSEIEKKFKITTLYDLMK
ncbi:MAG: glycoside hydrolase family 2 protein [Bacteroidota bacterium]